MKRDRIKEYQDSENKEIIDRTYNNYFSDNTQKNDKYYKEVFIDQIEMTATCSIVYNNCDLNDWIEKFKDEKEVLEKLKNISVVYNER